MKNVILLTASLALVSMKANALQLPTCVDRASGQNVPVITSTANQTPAFSTLDQQTGRPEIFINPQMLQNLKALKTLLLLSSSTSAGM